MSERLVKRPVPCIECIQRASTSGAKQHELSLCDRCTAMLQARTGPRFVHLAETTSSPSSISLLQKTKSNQSKNQHLTDSEHSAQSQVDLNWSKDRRAAISAKLKEYSRTYVEALNSRNFEHPIWSHTSPQVHVPSLDRYSPTNTLVENIRVFQAIAASDPTYHIDIQNIDIIFEEASNAVHAYMDMHVTGRPAGVVLNSLGVFTYINRIDDWELVSFNAIRWSGPAI